MFHLAVFLCFPVVLQVSTSLLWAATQTRPSSCQWKSACLTSSFLLKLSKRRRSPESHSLAATEAVLEGAPVELNVNWDQDEGGLWGGRGLWGGGGVSISNTFSHNGLVESQKRSPNLAVCGYTRSVLISDFSDSTALEFCLFKFSCGITANTHIYIYMYIPKDQCSPF